MKFQYLGTAAAEGIPAVFCQCKICREAERRGGKELRFRTSALINDKLLLDLSPDLYAAKLKFSLPLGNVRNIIITHAHGDHFNPKELFTFTGHNAYLDDRSDMHLWGSAYTAKMWEKAVSEIAELQKGFVFHILKPFETVVIEGVTVTALKAVHSCPESFIYQLEQGGAKMLYGNDTGPFHEETWAWLAAHNEKPFTTVSLDSTMGLPPSCYNGHMTLEENVQTRERMIKEGIALPTTRFICHHFSHNGLTLHKETEELMGPRGFEVSYDGKTFAA